MKIFRIAQESQEDQEITETRTLGKKVSDIKGIGRTKIYRAVENNVNEFKPKDYVTFSLKFAVEHAENNAIYYSEHQKVISAIVKNENLYEAYNPGEYFYEWETIAGKTIYQTKGFDFEGFEYLTSKDFM